MKTHQQVTLVLLATATAATCLFAVACDKNNTDSEKNNSLFGTKGIFDFGAVPDNLIVNGHFDGDAGTTVPTGWKIFTDDIDTTAAAHTVAIATDAGRDGDSCLKLLPRQVELCQSLSPAYIDRLRGGYARVSLWARAADGSTTASGLRFAALCELKATDTTTIWNVAATTTGDLNSACIDESEVSAPLQWTKYENVFPVSSDVQAITFYLSADCAQTSDISFMLFDDVQILRTERPSIAAE